MNTISEQGKPRHYKITLKPSGRRIIVPIGYPITIESYAGLFIHPLYMRNNEWGPWWQVSEETTGLAIARGATKLEAICDAANILSLEGVQSFDCAIKSELRRKNS